MWANTLPLLSILSILSHFSTVYKSALHCGIFSVFEMTLKYVSVSTTQPCAFSNTNIVIWLSICLQTFSTMQTNTFFSLSFFTLQQISSHTLPLLTTKFCKTLARKLSTILMVFTLQLTISLYIAYACVRAYVSLRAVSSIFHRMTSFPIGMWCGYVYIAEPDSQQTVENHRELQSFVFLRLWYYVRS